MRLRLLLVTLLMIVATLACAMDKKMEGLSVNSAPVRFTLFGETIYQWQVAVSPGVAYEVIIVKQVEKQNHPASLLEISVADVEVRRSNIVTSVEGNDDTVTATFVGPSSGNVNIYVSSKVWEGQDEIGILTIQIQEVSS